MFGIFSACTNWWCWCMRLYTWPVRTVFVEKLSWEKNPLRQTCGRLAGRQADRQAGGQTGRQTGRQVLAGKHRKVNLRKVIVYLRFSVVAWVFIYSTLVARQFILFCCFVVPVCKHGVCRIRYGMQDSCTSSKISVSQIFVSLGIYQIFFFFFHCEKVM